MTSGRSLRLLSFDGGGACSYSQLEILATVMHKLNWDTYPENQEKIMLPCEHFDMIAGSDTGGLLAIMFVKLRLSVEDAIQEFATILEHVYVTNLRPMERTSRLKKCMESLLKSKGFPVDLKLEDEQRDGRCLGFVVASPRANLAHKICLRTYRTRHDPPSAITVVEAALATCALPPAFLPVALGPRYERAEYVGAGLGANNPTRRALGEANSYFGAQRSISLLLSLGSGHPGILTLANGNADGLYQLMREMMIDCEREAQEIQQQMGHLSIYFRFSVEQGMHRQQTRADDLGWILTQTATYLSQAETMRRVDQCVSRMMSVKGSISLDQLGRIANPLPAPRDTRPISRAAKSIEAELLSYLLSAEEKKRSPKRTSSNSIAPHYQQTRGPQAQSVPDKTYQAHEQSLGKEFTEFMAAMGITAPNKHGHPEVEPLRFEGPETRTSPGAYVYRKSRDPPHTR